MVLGRRNNEPLKGQWLSPCSRIAKNEHWQDALTRIAKTELLLDISSSDCIAMGFFDHIYENSVVDNQVSTHFVNLPHLCLLDEVPKLRPDTQYHELRWHDLSEVAKQSQYHKYMNLYASWVLQHLSNQRK